MFLGLQWYWWLAIAALAYVHPLFLGVKGGKVVQIVHGAQIGVQVRELKQHADFPEKFLAVGVRSKT